MITPCEIEQQCQKWWKDVLISHINAIAFFPKEINHIGKITSRDIIEKFPDYQQSLAVLRKDAKPNKKWGYSLIETKRYFKKIGAQKVPDKIVIETLDDYLKLTKKGTEYQTFLRNYELIITELPSLKEWIIQHPQKLIEHDVWIEILKVCKYFISTPKPNLYVRELPINVHTKFITNNQRIISDLLNNLLPSDSINQEFTSSNDFEKRFYLKYPEPLVRFRIGDKQVSKIYFSGVNDISIPVSQFEQLQLPIERVLIVENKLNLLTIALTFPELEKTIIIFGSGYNVRILKNVLWLRNVELLYWGDLDVHGFEILSQFRGYFPQTQSILMDKETFDKFFENDTGTPTKITEELNLTNEEIQLYELLKIQNQRLEQEKIPLPYVKRWLNRHGFAGF
jgi:hypothetical protein